MLETLDYTIRIGSTPAILYFINTKAGSISRKYFV